DTTRTTAAFPARIVRVTAAVRSTDGSRMRSSHDLDAAAFRVHRELEARRRRRQIDVRFEMYAGRQRLHRQDVEIVPLAKLAVQGRKVTEADESDGLGQFE